ncbi:MAG TPA: hypothetical protein VK496_00810 [Gaiellaceae bacterium]|nr:hypothetical protein [Gaiellaceae bacterium]
MRPCPGLCDRFYNMFRVVKVTSPMSVGTWILGASGTALGSLAVARRSASFRVKLAAQTAAGLLGLPLTTYTAALVANTAVPIWHEARRELPFVFAGQRSGGRPAGACRDQGDGDAARAAARRAVPSRGRRPFREAGQGLHRGGRGAHRACGAEAGGRGGRRRLLLAGWLFERLERLAVYRAGTQSAADPKYTVVPPRERAARIGSKATTRPSGS